MLFGDRNKNDRGLRVIRTARDKDSINRAARSGLRPLVKKVEPSDKIRSKFAVVQFKETGEIEVIGDYRTMKFICECLTFPVIRNTFV